MWSFASERTLRRTAFATIAALALAAMVFYQVQNNLRPVGGDISIVKLLWLAGAILLWGVLPLLLLADPRLGLRLRRAFAALAALMLARAAVEGWMLYVTLNWSPWYGIAHDALCAAVLLAFAARTLPSNPLEGAVRVHLWVTAAFFAPEMYFAWYMQAHFTTQGETAVYFVPDEAAYADVLRATTVAVVCLAMYLPLFLRRWILVSGKESA
jgi:hypothetical protein